MSPCPPENCISVFCILYSCANKYYSDQESMFRKALNDALKKCKLMKTYDEALRVTSYSTFAGR